MSTTRRGPRPDLRLDVPEVEAPDHLAEQLAALARASVPSHSRTVTRPAVAVGVAAGVGLLSVGGAWAGGAISLPLVPDSPLVTRQVEKTPRPSQEPGMPGSPTAPLPSDEAATSGPGGTPDEHASERADERSGDRGPDERSSTAPGQEGRDGVGPDGERDTGPKASPSPRGTDRNKGQSGEQTGKQASERTKPNRAASPGNNSGNSSGQGSTKVSGQGSDPKATPAPSAGDGSDGGDGGGDDTAGPRTQDRGSSISPTKRSASSATEGGDG